MVRTSAVSAVLRIMVNRPAELRMLQPETEFDRRLRARIEVGQRRLAEARERGELQPSETGPLVEACRRRLMEAFGIR